MGRGWVLLFFSLVVLNDCVAFTNVPCFSPILSHNHQHQRQRQRWEQQRYQHRRYQHRCNKRRGPYATASETETSSDVPVVKKASGTVASSSSSSSSPEVGRKHFIRTIVEDDIASGKHAKIVTRFPPEPNGYLHIGHAKSVCLNFGLAKEYQGSTHMRFDDTNPVKEDMEYVNSILEDVSWLMSDTLTSSGDTPPSETSPPWDGPVRHSSDYFDLLYDCAVYLVKEGKAYVDSLSAEEMREYRGTLTTAGRNSPDRDGRSIAENLRLFEAMKDGEVEEGELVLRAKIDMASPNMNMRDPTLYRVRKNAVHPMTGDKWKVYPMYDYTHCISDALEGITHSLCTLEFADHRPLYDWILTNLADSGFIPCHPQQIEFSRLNLQYTVLSKRKLISLVSGGHVQGWDDPRMPTLAGVRRRGVPPEAMRLFCERIGISKAENNIDVGVLEDCARAVLDDAAPRAFAVLKPLKLTITNWPKHAADLSDGPFVDTFTVPAHPKVSGLGERQISMGAEVFIDREDFCDDTSGLTGDTELALKCGEGQETKPKGFNRLVPGGRVRLRYAFVVTCDEVVREPATGEVLELRGRYEPETRAGVTPPGSQKVKGIIQWVSVATAIEAEVRLYDRLFRTEEPGKSGEDNSGDNGVGTTVSGTADFLQDMNPRSVEVLRGCMIEPSAAVLAAPGRRDTSQYSWPPRPLQFERTGYFVHDIKDSTAEKPVFNRVVTLRDTWAAPAAPSGRSGKKKSGNNVGGGGASPETSKALGEGGANEDPRFPYVENAKLQKGVPDIARVELRVGKVLTCKPHPDAESLLVEEIDVGDAVGPRTVVSGLADFIDPDDFVGKKVVVVCNLKPAKMRGITSTGMVLCGSLRKDSGDEGEAEEIVELLLPPAEAAVGERITIADASEEESSAYPDKVLKSDGQQKVWKRVGKLLHANAESGDATYDGRVLLTSAGACQTPSLRDVPIG